MAIAGHEKVCLDKEKDYKNKVKPIRFNFELRETTPVNSESDTDDLDPENDGLPDPTIMRPPEIVKVYEENENGVKVENKRKSYKLTSVEERIGCYINLDEKYYTADSLEQFEINRQKLLKFNKEIKKKKLRGDEVTSFDAILPTT